MTIPLTLGLPQVILLVVGLVGLSLFITGLMGRRYMTEDEVEEYKLTGRPPRRRVRIGRSIGGIVLIVIAISLLWATFLVQTYLGLTGEIKVAHVHATPIANVAHEMSVELILYDSNGHATSDKTYLIHGDEWMVQGDILRIAAWLNVVGLHSGYKLTRLEGRYDDTKLEQTAPRSVIALNGGDDNFFQTMHANRGWLTPFVDATYGNAVYVPADGSYDVFATQDALIAKPGR